ASDLSTFSGHVRALNLVLAEARPGVLVLLDEIGAGTDPAEGAALGLAVLESLQGSGALVWAATHYQLIKTWAALTPGVVSAAVNATEAGQPLYGLAYGGPGFSGGLKMARRLGLPDDLVARAESYLDDNQRRAMELLARLDEERAALKRTREDLADQGLALARAESELKERTRRQTEEFQRRAETQNRAVTEALATVRREFEELKAEMRAASGFQARFSEKRAGLEQRLRSVRPQAESGENPLAGVRAGDRVRVGVLGRAAVVQTVNQERGEAWVEAGGLNVKVRLTELFPPEAETGRTGSVNITVTPAASAGLELHLLGRTVDEALGEVEKELDRAALAGRKTLYIVHGFGTGRLRQGIRRYLERHPRVKSFERAPQGAGGDGVTVVTLE
ncbi:MAG: Smr/MutS family protein, partial [Candidatus Adiutrix sp.]|nr:Smr/MutS family protein [Candidatus Adiutrix sp.]